MKKSIGNESQKLAREARRASRATLSASGGIGVPCSTLALVQAINLFWHRQIMPQTFRNMIVPSPPPTLIERVRLLAAGFVEPPAGRRRYPVATHSGFLNGEEANPWSIRLQWRPITAQIEFDSEER